MVRTLRLLEVSVRRGNRTLLKQITAEFPAGRHNIVAGDNGSGKSTVLRLVEGLVDAVSGTVVVEPEGSPGSLRTMLTLQEPAANIVMPEVADDLAFALRMRGAPYGFAMSRVESSLQELRCEGLRDRNALHLSGGQQALLALTQAIVNEPEVLLLDELTSSLDDRWTDAVLRAIEAFIRAHPDAIVVHATHDPRVLEAGQCVARLSRIGAVPTCPEIRGVATPATSGELGALEAVSVAVSGRVLLRDVSLRIQAGSRLTVFGANGCGKSSVLEVIAGWSSARSGAVLIEENAATSCVWQASDDAFSQYSVSAEMKLTGDPDTALGLINSAGLGERLADDPLVLSGGERRLLGLALACASRPHILIVDEPLTGLDECGRRYVIALLEAMQARGTAVVVSCHRVRDALALGGHVLALLGDGRWRLFDEPLESQLVAAAYGGTSAA